MALFSKIGIPKKTWVDNNVKPVSNINQADSFLYGAGSTTVSSLLASGKIGARARAAVYDKWSLMESDAICSSAMSLLVSSALGGHETTGQMVFIEKAANIEKDSKLSKMVDEISGDLSGLLNKVAYQMAYTGSSFGDAYARIYSENKIGVVDLYTDEMIRPQLVQPFERGSKTIGYIVYTGDRNFERLDVSQLVRVKMPRTQWVPQHGVVEKSLKIALTENDIKNLPIMPSMAGGSFLFSGEESYDNLSSSLMGLVGQRWKDSIDEQILKVNLDSMTDAQQDKYINSITTMLTKSKQVAEDAVKNGTPVMERIRHIIPIFNDKQVTTLEDSTASSTASISIDDVMLHARLLAGALGVDLSMLGFADLLSGGLGEGVSFRTSTQAAEKARTIRTSLSDFFDDVIDIHTLNKYGFVFSKNERPWKINFYGSISALEAEKTRTKSDAMNAGMLLVQAIQMFKDAGATEDMMRTYLTNEMMLDEDEAALYAAIVAEEENKQEME